MYDDVPEVGKVTTPSNRVLKAGQPDPQKTIVYPAAQKFSPRPPSIKPRDEISTSHLLRELRDEHENSSQFYVRYSFDI